MNDESFETSDAAKLVYSLMAEEWSIFADWNPWHGCTKVSPGCRFCYVYRQDEMYGSEIASNLARKTAAFNLPVKRKRDKTFKIPSGKIVFTCFTSDFLLEDADPWRPECWEMMRFRSDCMFYFFTKRIDRLDGVCLRTGATGTRMSSSAARWRTRLWPSVGFPYSRNFR